MTPQSKCFEYTCNSAIESKFKIVKFFRLHPDQVVMGGDLHQRGREFESRPDTT